MDKFSPKSKIRINRSMITKLQSNFEIILYNYKIITWFLNSWNKSSCNKSYPSWYGQGWNIMVMISVSYVNKLKKNYINAKYKF